MVYEAFPHRHFPVTGSSCVPQLILKVSECFKKEVYAGHADLQGIVTILSLVLQCRKVSIAFRKPAFSCAPEIYQSSQKRCWHARCVHLYTSRQNQFGHSREERYPREDQVQLDLQVCS